MTSERDRAELIRIAREAVRARVGGLAFQSPDVEGVLAQPAAAFVTLHRAGALRGCIGHIQPNLPLARVVAQCAASAATEDPRFPPVNPDEVAALDIELSVLGALEPVATIDDVVVGRHGLVVEQGWKRGLLLPQVAIEWKWDAKTFVEQTCQKAGLARDAWPRIAKLFRFEAEVFGER